jgi:N-acetylneuraminic acid mutarotase
VASGTLADGRLSANVPLLNANQTFSGANTFAGIARLTNTGNILVGVHSGHGSGLVNVTGVSASSFTGPLSGDVTGTQGATVVNRVAGVNAGTVAAGASAANAATSANTPGTIVQRDASGSFSAGPVSGTFLGGGPGLTGLNAGNVASGRLADARLSANVPLLDASQTFGGANTFAGAARLTNSGNILVGTHSGDGSGLTNLSMSSISGLEEASRPAGSLVVSSLPQDSTLIASGYRLTTTIPSPSWANGSASGALGARYGHTAVWDGAEMIIWGGALGSGVYASSGAAYHPDTDLWQPISTIGAPSPRSGHSAIWTGSQIIIWGGVDTNGYAPAGARYTAATGLWSPVATGSAPSPRGGHIAVWTGAGMLVWGGRYADGLLNDGALYDPVLDQWAALGVSSPPAARSGATAVWAGDRLIVWGGQGTNDVLGDGAELLFSSTGLPLRWTNLNSANAPGPRQGHSAVWTGAKMIVWGGRNAVGPLADGAAYDPVTDSWEPLPSLNAPAGRFDHAAVWTGQEMVIIAGTGVAGELSSGGAYDPLTARWSSLNSSGGPLCENKSGRCLVGN